MAFFFEPDLLPLIPRTYMIETESHSCNLFSGLSMHTAGICKLTDMCIMNTFLFDRRKNILKTKKRSLNH